jgi:hypothetical protein
LTLVAEFIHSTAACSLVVAEPRPHLVTYAVGHASIVPIAVAGAAIVSEFTPVPIFPSLCHS